MTRELRTLNVMSQNRYDPAEDSAKTTAVTKFCHKPRIPDPVLELTDRPSGVCFSPELHNEAPTGPGSGGKSRKPPLDHCHMTELQGENQIKTFIQLVYKIYGWK